MQNPEEMWQADVNGEVYDASFGELTNWVAESSLLETDKVRRGKLRWLEAGKVPQLREFFNAKHNGTEPPFVYVTTTESKNKPPNIEQIDQPINLPDNQIVSNAENAQTQQNFVNETNEQFGSEPQASVCDMHPELTAEYFCQACSHSFCSDCPQRFGSNVRVCPYCGAMCKQIDEFQAENEKELQYQRDMAEGFGFSDFGKALSYPFQFKSSLFFGGLIVAILGIGQAAGGYASPFMIAAALICFMLANAITFGVLANTIDNFAQGKIGKDFMPSFDDFSLWDDVVHPLFLSIAVYISSFGLVIAVVLGMAWYTWSSLTSEMNMPASTPYSGIQETQQTQDHIKKVLDKYKRQNEGRTNLELGEDGLTAGQRATLDEEAEFQRINDLTNQLRKDQLESTIGPTPETEQAAKQAIALKLIKAAGVFLIFAVIGLIWGIFYFPAAVAVAGYTRSFTATLNPLIGLDTIKHLGFDYFKVWIMWILIGIISLIFSAILMMIFSPFNMPRFGNIPASFVGSFITFYLSAVFAVTLGFAIYKNSEKLKLFRR